MADLNSLVTRLEAVATRLEGGTSGKGGATSGGSGKDYGDRGDGGEGGGGSGEGGNQTNLSVCHTSLLQQSNHDLWPPQRPSFIRERALLVAHLRAKFNHILSLHTVFRLLWCTCVSLHLAAVKRLEEVTVRLEAIKAVGRKSGGGGT